MSSFHRKASFTRDERVRQALRLKLLALVLALALTWYALNPAPGPVRRHVRGGGEPDAKRREGKSPGVCPPSPVLWPEPSMFGSDTPASVSPSRDEPEELDWPEYISLD